MPTISVLEFAAYLAGFDSSSFFGVTLRTCPKMTKKSRIDKSAPHWSGDIVKTQSSLYRIGTDYGNTVRNQREREGHENPEDFQTEENWFRRIGDSPLVVGKSGDKAGKFYVFLILHKSGEATFTDSAGVEWSRESLAGFLPVPSSGTKQETDKPVVVNTITLTNILSVRIGGQEYTIDHGTAAAAMLA